MIYKTKLLFIGALLLFSSICIGQSSNNYTTLDGLSHNTVYQIEQDDYGLIWLATESGLSIFDGNNFNLVQPIYRDSLPSHFITSIEIKSPKEVWVGTTKGLRVIDQVHEKIINALPELENKTISHIKKLNDNLTLIGVNNFGIYLIDNQYSIIEHWYLGSSSISLSSNQIEKIGIDKTTGLVWVTNKETGIDLINMTNHYITTFPIGNGVNQVPSKKVYCITQDKENNIWVGTSKGIAKYDAKSKTLFSVHKRAFFNTTILSIHSDSKGDIWIGTELNGLWKISAKTNNQLTRVALHHEITNQSIRSIYEDIQHNIWVGTQRRGVYLLKDQYHTFKLIKKDILSSNIIWGITLDKKNNIWAGTDGQGITKYNLDNKTTKKYIHDGNESSLSDNNIISALTTKKGELWFGTYSGGLNKYDTITDKFIHYTIDNGLLKNDVRALAEDNDSTLWVGTNRGGLHFINEKENKAISIDATRTMDIRSITSKDNLVWFGTYGDGGIFTYDKQSNKLLKVKLPFDIEITFDLFFDNNAPILWIGSFDKGLLAYHYKEKRLEEFKIHPSLSTNIIHAIQQDKNGVLWLTTNHGIVAFNYIKNTITKHGIDEGIQQHDFMDGSRAIGKDGTIYFGGAGGLNYFHPKNIKISVLPPQILLTKLEVYNKTIRANDKSKILLKNISDTKSITLDSEEAQFSIAFQGIDYRNHDALQYRYFMKGLDSDWNLVGKNNSANYSNINPGAYQFNVSTKSIGGKWSKPATLEIKVLPPIWATWWAKLLYFCIIILGAWYWKDFTGKRAEIRSKLKLQEEQTNLHKENKEVYEDIINELNTPINQLLMPLENMIHNNTNTSPALRKQLQLLYLNASKMHNIVRFILSNKDRDEQHFKLEVYQYNLSTFLLNFRESFLLQAAQLGVKIDIQLPENDITAWFDIEKIETILHFLFLTVFQNATTSDQLLIVIDVTENNQINYANINLYLIDGEMREKKIDLEMRKTALIGIPMSEWFLKKHKGSLLLPSSTSNRICITIPIDKETYTTDEIKLDAEENGQFYFNNELIADNTSTDKLDKTAHTITLLDDNKDTVAFFSSILSEYNIVAFDNSVELFQYLGKNDTDIILIDNTLNSGSGIDIIKRLKKDAKLAIIPSILIASHLTEKNKVNGLKAGADLCISKPFHISILKTHIQNLINSRQYFKNIYRNEILTETKEVVPVNEDEILIAKITDLIENNMSNPDFKVQSIQDEIGISQSSLYKKIKQQTGMSSSEFLRNFRIKFAAKLLAKSNLPVAEVMMKVGFSDAKYFRTSFKKKYELSPSQYRKEHQKESD
ncbi:helix-turn-helix domain-containing protein [Flammeovirga pectinis]|uniref:Helix-turn-helix domain-containing protein n=1 Tax=Flammeovirga pectinis TaxID=2494373 RepID=A0A3S9NZP2_9BACT|nr:two-component regulator propeller domain-containing protein [Flammeovirga pectinis]AZQ61405.1 helix-turn-helix domain-containing protein [Flammeovirga pectinis]